MKILCQMISVVKYYLVLIFLLLSCDKKLPIVHLTGQTMGTTYNIKFIRNSTITISNKEIAKFIDLRLQTVNLAMSSFESESELSKFNRFSTYEWFSVSKDFYQVLSFSKKLAIKTNGLYDPTIGPLVNLWGFGTSKFKKVPSDSKINEVLKIVGHRFLELSDDYKIMKKVDKLHLDLSSSAKGFAVDKIAEMLEKLTITNYMVEIGGELVTKGSRNVKPWTIGIEFPNNDTPEKAIIKRIKSKNYAIATSGNYRNFYRKLGKKYSHIINTKTGRPVQNDLLSATVITKGRCMKADGIATALMVMGIAKAQKFSELNNIAAYLIYNNNGRLDTHYTKAFERLGL